MKKLLSLFSILSLLSPLVVNAAITRDTSSSATSNTGTTLSWSHTVTAGSNTYLIVVAGTDGSSGWSSATYNGVSMTSLGTFSDTNQFCAKSSFYQAWGLANPTTGSNTVLVTAADNNKKKYAYAASYYGVKQTAQPDVQGGNSDGSHPVTITKTVVTGGARAVTLGCSDTSTTSGGTNATAFGAEVATGVGLYDSEGVTIAAGSFSMAINASAGSMSAYMAVLDQVPDAVASNFGYFTESWF